MKCPTGLRHWFQFHLLTAVVAMIAAGGLMMLNIGPHSKFCTIGGVKHLAFPPSPLSDLEIRIFRFGYISGDDARQMIEEIWRSENWDELWFPAVIQFEKRANVLVVRAPSETLDAIQDLIDRINIPRAAGPLYKAYRKTGWPWAVDRFSIQKSEKNREIDWAALAADIVIGFLMLFVVATMCEWLIRRSTSKRHSVHVDTLAADSI